MHQSVKFSNAAIYQLSINIILDIRFSQLRIKPNKPTKNCFHCDHFLKSLIRPKFLKLEFKVTDNEASVRSQHFQEQEPMFFHMRHLFTLQPIELPVSYACLQQDRPGLSCHYLLGSWDPIQWVPRRKEGMYLILVTPTIAEPPH